MVDTERQFERRMKMKTRFCCEIPKWNRHIKEFIGCQVAFSCYETCTKSVAAAGAVGGATGDAGALMLKPLDISKFYHA